MVSRPDRTGPNRRAGREAGRILDSRRTFPAGRFAVPGSRRQACRGAYRRRRARHEHYAMTLLNETDLQSFVLLRLGDRRFAVTATQIAELVAPSRVFRFPHHTGEV